VRVRQFVCSLSVALAQFTESAALVLLCRFALGGAPSLQQIIAKKIVKSMSSNGLICQWLEPTLHRLWGRSFRCLTAPGQMIALTVTGSQRSYSATLIISYIHSSNGGNCMIFCWMGTEYGVRYCNQYQGKNLDLSTT
jgi:hypothetical protein